MSSPALRWSAARLPASLAPGALHAARAAAGDDIIDLMCSNPTAVGLRGPEITVALSGGALAPYAAAAGGDPQARAAVAAYACARGDRLAAADVVLTASTSEAYAYALKLLCGPGEAVAVPTPSYPLVAHLAELEAVRWITYPLRLEAGRWGIDVDAVARCLTAGARAVVLVAPHSPTGTPLAAAEAAEVAALCAAAGAAVILDQVFAPYASAGAPRAAGLLAAAPLTLQLDGLSKAAGMPGVKLGWIGLSGAAAPVAAARERLLWIADAYLSVGAPVQAALPALLAAAPAQQAAISARTADSRRCLRRALAAVPAVTDVAVGGWYAVLRLPQHVDEDEAARALLAAGVWCHPGYFYDFAGPSYLVVGLLLPPEVLARALAAMVPVLAALCA